jgi:hypothetical protein
MNPIVKLGSSSYRHQAYGKINVPALQVLSWSDAEPDKPMLTDGNVVSTTRQNAPTHAAAPIDDDIPF